MVMNRYNALKRLKNRINYAKKNVLASILPKRKRTTFYKVAKKRNQKKLKIFVKIT